MAAKNVQMCADCGKKIEGSFRMVLMMGPKGYRRYAVHEVCTNAPAAKRGGRQAAAARAKTVV